MSDLNNVLVVGGGIGGMAATILLAESGVKVDLVDLDPAWKVYGAGITITGPTLRAYRHLNMIEDIKAEGAITNGSRIFRYDGEWLRDLDEPALEEGLPATGGIMRPVLHEIMQRRIRSLDVPVRLGLTVKQLTNTDDGVEVLFSDDSTGRYDLVVGSDSVYSTVRDIAFPHMGAPQWTGQACWRLSMKRPPNFDRSEFYFGGPYPAGITACGPDSCYMWLLTPCPKPERIAEEDQPRLLKELLKGFGGSAGWMRDNMTGDDWVNYRPLAAAIQPGPWSNGRIVLLGDAAHATTPHLASGAGMAVESAIVLAEELNVADRSVEDSLAAYEERRFPRCNDVVTSSIAIGAKQLAGGTPDEVGAMIGGALHRLAQPF